MCFDIIGYLFFKNRAGGWLGWLVGWYGVDGSMDGWTDGRTDGAWEMQVRWGGFSFTFMSDSLSPCHEIDSWFEWTSDGV